jgi:hypothetical protein
MGFLGMRWGDKVEGLGKSDGGDGERKVQMVHLLLFMVFSLLINIGMNAR